MCNRVANRHSGHNKRTNMCLSCEKYKSERVLGYPTFGALETAKIIMAIKYGKM